MHVIYTQQKTQVCVEFLVKDTALFDEGRGSLQVLSHTQFQHDCGKPSPAENNSNQKQMIRDWPIYRFTDIFPDI